MKLSNLENFTTCLNKKNGRPPTLHAKVITDYNDNILTEFYEKKKLDDPDESGVMVANPLKLLGKECTVNAAIEFESIYIGDKISLQVKLYELEFMAAVKKPKRKRLLTNC